MNYPIKANLELIDADGVSAYLDMLFGYVDFEPHHIVALRPQGEKGTAKEGHPGGDVWLQPGLIGFDAFKATVLEWVKGYAQTHQAAFLIPGVMNRAAGTAEAVDLFTAVVVDLDKGDTLAALAHIRERVGMPSMVIESGGTTETGAPKMHVYWRLTEPTSDITKVMKARHWIACKLGGDRALGVPKDDRTGLGRAHQPIRIAGSVHAKNGVAKGVKIVAQADRDFDLDELLDLVETLPVLSGMPGAEDPAQAKKQEGFTYSFSPAAIPDPFAKEEIGAALSSDIGEGGDGDRNRWTEFNRVAGAYIRQARDGTIDIGTAAELTRGWMHAKMHPAWPDDRFEREFKALQRRDAAEASKVALAEAKGAVPLIAPAFAPGPLQSPAAQSAAKVQGAGQIATLDQFGAARWKGRARPERQFLVKGLMMPAKHHMLVAEGGAGKTFLGIELAVKVAAPRDGDTWMGQDIDTQHCGAVVMFTTEDDTDELSIRLHEMAVTERVDEAVSCGRLYIVPTLEAGGAFALVAREKDGTAKLSPRWEYWLGQIAQVQGLKLVIVDTFNSTMHGEENSATIINEYVQALTVICGRLGAAVLVTHHVRKQGENPIVTPEDMLNAVRGSGAISASFRVVMGVWHESDYERVLKGIGVARPEDRTLYRMAVIKGNNPQLLKDVKYLRREPAGHLQDATAAITSANQQGGAERTAWVLYAVEHSDEAGHPMTRRAHWDRRTGWPTIARTMSRHEFDNILADLIASGAVVEIQGAHGGKKRLEGALVGPQSRYLMPAPPDPETGKYKLPVEGKSYQHITGRIG